MIRMASSRSVKQITKKRSCAECVRSVTRAFRWNPTSTGLPRKVGQEPEVEHAGGDAGDAGEGGQRHR
jgi:hypothetical protein